MQLQRSAMEFFGWTKLTWEREISFQFAINDAVLFHKLSMTNLNSLGFLVLYFTHYTCYEPSSHTSSWQSSMLNYVKSFCYSIFSNKFEKKKSIMYLNRECWIIFTWQEFVMHNTITMHIRYPIQPFVFAYPAFMDKSTIILLYLFLLNFSYIVVIPLKFT